MGTRAPAAECLIVGRHARVTLNLPWVVKLMEQPTKLFHIATAFSWFRSHPVVCAGWALTHNYREFGEESSNFSWRTVGRSGAPGTGASVIPAQAGICRQHRRDTRLRGYDGETLGPTRPIHHCDAHGSHPSPRLPGKTMWGMRMPMRFLREVLSEEKNLIDVHKPDTGWIFGFICDGGV